MPHHPSEDKDAVGGYTEPLDGQLVLVRGTKPPPPANTPQVALPHAAGIAEPWVVRFWVPGKPMPWRRSGGQRRRLPDGRIVHHRFDTNTEFQAAVTQTARSVLQEQGLPLPVWGAGTAVRVLVVSMFASRKPPLKRGSRPREAIQGMRSDVDNLAKNVLDSLNNVLWEDDGQITRLECTKLRAAQGEPEGTAVFARPAERYDLGDFDWVDAEDLYLTPPTTQGD